jgi:hypothetical protein
MTWTAKATAMLVLSALVAACGAEDRSVSPVRVPPTPSAEDPLVVLKQSGGFTGMETRAVVKKNGSVEVERDGNPTRFEVPMSIIDRLRGALGNVDWSVAAGNHLPKDVALNDVVIYELHASDQVARGAGITPEERSLKPVMALLTDIVEATARRPDP